MKILVFFSQPSSRRWGLGNALKQRRSIHQPSHSHLPRPNLAAAIHLLLTFPCGLPPMTTAHNHLWRLPPATTASLFCLFLFLPSLTSLSHPLLIVNKIFVYDGCKSLDLYNLLDWCRLLQNFNLLLFILFLTWITDMYYFVDIDCDFLRWFFFNGMGIIVVSIGRKEKHKQWRKVAGNPCPPPDMFAQLWKTPASLFFLHQHPSLFPCWR